MRETANVGRYYSTTHKTNTSINKIRVVDVELFPRVRIYTPTWYMVVTGERRSITHSLKPFPHSGTRLTKTRNLILSRTHLHWPKTKCITRETRKIITKVSFFFNLHYFCRPQDLEPLTLNTERADSPIRHQQLSPKVNIVRYPKRRSSGSFDSCIRYGSSESNCSNLNADQETDPGSVSYSSSRQMSMSSVRSESGNQATAAGSKPPLLRSSSSRSTFLSVPVRIVPNSQQQQQPKQQHRRRPSFQSGCSSPLMMASRSSSLSK